MTLQAAAATLAISPSRLRRWADEGGSRRPHRRRAPALPARSRAPARGRARRAPGRPARRAARRPLPMLGQNLRAGTARQMAAAATAAIYREGTVRLVRAPRSRRGRPARLDHRARPRLRRPAHYGGALQASESLMRAPTCTPRGCSSGTRFSSASARWRCARWSARAPSATEIACTRRLFASLQQALLETRD